MLERSAKAMFEENRRIRPMADKIHLAITLGYTELPIEIKRR